MNGRAKWSISISVNTQSQESGGRDRFFFGKIDGRDIMFVQRADHSVCIASSQPELVQSMDEVLADLRGDGRLNSLTLSDSSSKMNASDFVHYHNGNPHRQCHEGWDCYICGDYMITAGHRSLQRSVYDACYRQMPFAFNVSYLEAVEACSQHQVSPRQPAESGRNAGEFLGGLVLLVLVAGFLVFKFAVPVCSLLFCIWVLCPAVILVPLFVFILMFFIGSACRQREDNQRRISRSGTRTAAKMKDSQAPVAAILN
jgi:hypothetical protein